MFEKLIFNKNQIDLDEKALFERNKKDKGIYLLKQIYDVQLEIHNYDLLTYDDIISVIRYDKSLRDQLYIFLAVFEEALKTDLFRKYDVDNQEIIYTHKNYKSLIDNIKEKVDFNYSNLYYCFQLELGQIIELIKVKEIYDADKIAKMEKVRQLRNKVMHHNVLVLGNAKTKLEMEKAIKELNSEIEALYAVLPINYQSKFQEILNDKIGRKYMKKICLGEMINGICS